MKLSVRLFAVARQLAERETLTLELPEGATLAQLRRVMLCEVPKLATVMPHLMFAIDSQYATEHTVLSEGSDVACIPPVSGG